MRSTTRARLAICRGAPRPLPPFQRALDAAFEAAVRVSERADAALKAVNAMSAIPPVPAVEQRPISKTVLPSGAVVIDIGDTQLSLTSEEARVMARLWQPPFLKGGAT